MPVSILDYVPTMAKTIAHWQLVEAKTGRPLLLRDKTTRTQLTTLKTRLETLQTQNLAESNDRERAQEVRDGAIKILHPLVRQARTSLKGLTERVPGAGALPGLLPGGSDPQRYVQAARDIAEIWGKINALDARGNADIGLPLTIPILRGETTVQVSHAEFVAAIDAYQSAVGALVATKSAETLGKRTRDTAQKLAKGMLLAYPAAAKMRLADGDPLRTTIPTFSGG
jgi:hypothetical protein